MCLSRRLLTHLLFRLWQPNHWHWKDQTGKNNENCKRWMRTVFNLTLHRSFVTLRDNFTVKWFPFDLLRHHWNLKKDIEDQKLENEKLRRQSATINQRTEHLESHRLALEKSLNELTEQLNALNQQQFNVNGEKKTLAEIQSLLKVSDDKNSVLKGIEKLSLGKLNYFLRYM